MERREFRANNRAGGWIVNVIAAALLLLILVGPPIIGQALLARGMAPWLYSIFVALAGFIPVLSQNWEIYRKIWHAARIAAGHLIYILFAPFNHSRHILPRLTVFWLLGVLLAIPGGKWLLEDRATSPLADEWLNDAARFVSEDALEPRSGAKARSISAMVGIAASLPRSQTMTALGTLPQYGAASIRLAQFLCVAPTQ